MSSLSYLRPAKEDVNVFFCCHCPFLARLCSQKLLNTHCERSFT